MIFDISFFLPSGTEFNNMTADVNDTIRSLGGDLIEQVCFINLDYSIKSERQCCCIRYVFVLLL